VLLTANCCGRGSLITIKGLESSVGKWNIALMNGKITIIRLEFSAGKWNTTFKKLKKKL
jgi:hypothetical protein